MLSPEWHHYETLKTLLQHVRFTEERYSNKLPSAKPDNSETGTLFAGRLFEYFDHWQQVAKTDWTYDAVRDTIVSKQFLMGCHTKLAVFIRKNEL